MCTNSSSRWIVALVVVGIVGIAALVPARLAGQSGTRSSANTSFEQRFWDYLQEAHYENWAPLPGKRADFYPGESPHGDFLKIYLNRTAAADPGKMPHGSIIVKENYGKDKKTLMALTIMYRTKGYDSERGDWYYVKYEPDGRASRMEGRPVAGKVKMCIDCHSGAKGDDYVFINDD